MTHPSPVTARQGADRILIERYGAERTSLAAEAEAVRVKLRDAVRRAIKDGMSESEAARLAGVTRMTVRAWLGKGSK